MKNLSQFIEKQAKWLLLSSILVLLYAVFSTYFDVYAYVLTGALYELFWLPMLFLVFVLPLCHLTLLLINIQNLNKVILVSLLVNIISLVLIFKK